MISTFKSLLTDESGATAIEYGLIAALVSVACVGGLTLVGGNLEDLFTNDIATKLDTAGS